MMEEIENPLESLRKTMVFDPRDWFASGKRDAWLYGVVIGWDENLDEVATKYGWDNETKARLERLHTRFGQMLVEENKQHCRTGEFHANNNSRNPSINRVD